MGDWGRQGRIHEEFRKNVMYLWGIGEDWGVCMVDSERQGRIHGDGKTGSYP